MPKEPLQNWEDYENWKLQNEGKYRADDIADFFLEKIATLKSQIKERVYLLERNAIEFSVNNTKSEAADMGFADAKKSIINLDILQ